MKGKVILIIAAAMMIVAYVSAQAVQKVETLTMKSTPVCSDCKDRIVKGLSAAKGVKTVSVDLKKKEVTVKYDPSKTTPAEIRTALTRVGYDADNLKADPKAYAKLPACCKEE